MKYEVCMVPRKMREADRNILKEGRKAGDWMHIYWDKNGQVQPDRLPTMEKGQW